MEDKIIVVSLAIIFNNEGKILLTKRHQPGSELVHNKWQLPGGGVKGGENPIDAAFREVKEEVGLDVTMISEYPILYNSVYNKHILLLCFPVLANVAEDEPIILDHEAREYGWFKQEEIDYDNALARTRDIIEKAVKIYQGKKN